MTSVALPDVVSYLDDLLDTPRFQFPEEEEINGLHVDAGRPVTRIAAAVNTSFMSIEGAAAAGAELLVVHHGSFASVDLHLHERKHAALREAGVSLYQAHACLDCHPEIGTGVTLARLLGLSDIVTFFPYMGGEAGAHGRVEGSFEAFVRRCTEVLEVPVAAWENATDFGHVGIATGGAGYTSHVEVARAEGCDTYLTGEGSMYTQLYAREAGINLVFGTHYATEAPATKALGARASQDLGVPWTFIEEYADVR